MVYESMPLYPSLPPGDGQGCVRVPLFAPERRGPDFAPGCPQRRVMIENPCRPGERVEVLLSVDACGNLVVCVRREPFCDNERLCLPRGSCRPREPRCQPEPCSPPCPRCDCGRGRLYGTWR